MVRRDHGPLMLAVALAALIVLVRVLSPGVPDTGDGVAHYQHAHYFWHSADAALSQWGKPLFSLLSSPFAALGLWGMTVFAAECGVVSCVAVMAFAPDERRRGWAWVVPVLLFSVPVYVHTLLCGLTEPFFGLMTVLIVWSLWKERFTVAMVLLSLMPFVRPEYAAFAPFALAYVLWRKAWNALPWGLTGVVLYSLASAVLHGHPLAFFTDHTYVGNSIYGHGDARLFYDNIDAMYGLPFKRALLVAVLAWAVISWRDREHRRAHLTLGLLTLLPAIAIFSLHTYAWWHGGMASLGLLRVMATTVPLLVLFVAYVLAHAWALFVPAARWSPWVLGAAFLVYGNTAFHELRRREPMPVAEDDIQHTVREASAFLQTHRTHGQRLYYLDPYLGTLCDRNPWDGDSARFLQGMGVLSDAQEIKDGDWVVWDAHFAAHEGGVPLDSLAGDPRFTRIATFAPATPVQVFGGMPYAIHLFQRSRTGWMAMDSTWFDLNTPPRLLVEAFDTTGRSPSGLRFGASSYPLALLDLPCGAPDAYNEEVRVHLSVTDLAPGDSVLLAFAENTNGVRTGYHHERIRPGDQDIVLPTHPLVDGRHNKLYLWNVTRHPFTLQAFQVRWSALRPKPR